MIDNNFKIDFVGIGAPKCATTWIYECLQEHPELCFVPKDQAQTPLFSKDNFSKKELKDCQSFYEDKSKCKIKGHFYIWYLIDEKVAQRIVEHNPEAKIIVCLRNPIDRVYSYYRYSIFSRNKKWKNLKQAIQEESKILEASFYYKHLRKFYDLFPKNHILTLIYEEIKRDPIVFIQEIYKFLGVDSSFIPPSAQLKINVSQFKLTFLGRFLHKWAVRPLLKYTKWGWKLKRSPLIKKYYARFVDFYIPKKSLTPPMKEETRNYLIKVFKEDIQNLGRLIDRDLNFWK